MFFKSELIAFAPEIFLIIIIHFLILYCVFCSTASILNYPVILKNITWLGIQIISFSYILTIYNPINSILGFNNLLILDEFSKSIKTIILIIAILTILMSLKYNQFENNNVFEFIILIILAIIGILLLISALDLVVIYLSIEIQSFCLYILAAFNRSSEFSTEAGLKYFVLGAFSSGLLLFGFSLIYGFLGVTNLNHLFQFLTVIQFDNFIIKGINLASLFILAAMLFKLSAAPFHIWVSDIYEGAPTSITAFFAIVPKIAILSILTRISFLGFYDLVFSWQELLILSSILSIIIGTFAGLIQLKLKRLFAYSTISHIGYILLGICSGSIDGLEASYIYIIFYIWMTIICFTTILGIYEQKNLNRLIYLKDLTILTRSNPVIGFIFSLTFLSIAGVPPLAGFFSKMFLFFAIIKTSMYLIALIGVLASVISCFYYIRIIKLSFFETTYCWKTLIRFDREKAIILIFNGILLLGIGIYPSLIIDFIHNSIVF